MGVLSARGLSSPVSSYRHTSHSRQSPNLVPTRPSTRRKLRRLEPAPINTAGAPSASVLPLRPLLCSSVFKTQNMNNCASIETDRSFLHLPKLQRFKYTPLRCASASNTPPYLDQFLYRLTRPERKSRIDMVRCLLTEVPLKSASCSGPRVR